MMSNAQKEHMAKLEESIKRWDKPTPICLYKALENKVCWFDGGVDLFRRVADRHVMERR